MEKIKSNPSQIKKNKEEGHAGLLFLLLLSFVAVFFLYFSFSTVKTHETIAAQMETTLCFQTTVNMTKDLIEKIIFSNKIILASYVAKNIPGPHIQAANFTHKSAQIFQQAYYGISIMKLLKNKGRCSYKNIYNAVKNLPIKRKGYVVLSRDLEGRAIIEDKKWTIKQSIATRSYIAEKITMIANFKLEDDQIKLETQWREDSLKSKLQSTLDYLPL